LGPIQVYRKMKRLKFQSGLTLGEMLIVVGIIAVLASIALRLATRIEGQGRERLTRATISILNAALEQFADYKYRYPNEAYRVFDFPVDCTEYPDPCGLRPNIFQPTMEDVMSEPQSGRAASITPPGMLAFHRTEYSGCEAMWFFLNQVPDCRKTLDRIDKSLVRAADANNVPLLMEITLPTATGTDTVRDYPLTRVVDAWGTTLHYDYYDEMALNGLFPVNSTPQSATAMSWVVDSKKTFPVITSAGPDRLFNTSDDIQVERKP
jgi:prepilin-type N-terminal cleavage/methylation domain-containing protein